ncbi:MULTISPECIES: hypothetical protein [Actinomadura]|uniref:Chain length determinant protein n=1 Tax=Actinomadura yumaensis TaxID=111807 RepID=A0ABW2CTT8_9ACTN|nr:hypothetical protein [Actinomadura sp. J1-007]MWK36286.1 hypothetical protein [Actinomadura sp. J1-007]
MEIDEVAARVVRSYWGLLLVMTVLPLLLVGYVVSGQDPPEVAKTRIQASSKATDAAPGDAGVSIVVSQVKAFATSRNLMDGVLRAQPGGPPPDKLAKAVSVTGLGTSTVVELAVKDADPRVARGLADALSAAVVKEINESNQGSITGQIAEIDRRVRELEKRLGPLSRRAGAVPNPDIGAANERERVQAELTDLRSSRSDLRGQLSASGSASVVQPAVLAPKSDPAVMMAAIAGLVGLVAGILVAVVLETFRPTVPGQRRVARRLGVPLLGWADRSPSETADLGRRVRLAAKRNGVGKVTLVAAGDGPLPAELVSAIAAAVYGDATKVVASRAARRRPGPAAGGGDGNGTDGGTADEDAKATAKDGAKDPAKDGDGPALNSSGPSGGKRGASVVRAGPGTAVMAKKPGEAAVPAGVSATDVTQPVPFRAVCHVHAFEDIDPGSDDEVGVVAVAGPVTLVSGLESVRDLVAASGWPLLGVIATTRATKGKTR